MYAKHGNGLAWLAASTGCQWVRQFARALPVPSVPGVFLILLIIVT